MKVCFNDTEEFLIELRRNRERITVPVRATQRFTQTKFSPLLQHVEVVAGYVAPFNGTTMLVELAQYCGEHLNGDPRKMALDMAQSAIDRITAECNTLKLEVRAGVYKEEA